MLAIIFAILTYLGWGSGDVLDVAATRRMGALKATFWIYVGGLLISSLYIPFALKDLARFNIYLLLLNIAIGLIITVCFMAFNEAVKIGNSSIVEVIANSFSILVVIFSLIFFGESLSLYQGLAILIILLGLIFSSLKFADLKMHKLLDKSTIIALLVMFGWGIGFTFIKIPIKQVGWFWPAYIVDLTGLLLLLSKNIRHLKNFVSIQRTNFLLTFVDGFLQSLGNFSYTFALSIGAMAIVAPIVGAYPTLFILLARFVFKDRLNKQQGFGIVFTLIGIILLAFFSR